MNARPVILATGGLAAAAAATLLLMHNRVAAQSAPNPKPAAGAPAIGISSEVAENRPLTFAIQATGQVAADENHTVRLSPRVGGRVVEVKVKVGDTVQAGDVVATVASSDLQSARAAYTQAKTKLELARRVLDLKQRLNGEGAFTQKQVEDAKHDYEDAQTERAAAEAAVGQAKDALALAKSELARKQKLVELGGLSQKPVEDARNELSEAESDRISGEAALAAAKTDLDRLQRLYVGGVAA
jgi:multidrug efflux pump subunit AcrA (membrane-fusion protein)